jgi:hypothetical protein
MIAAGRLIPHLIVKVDAAKFECNAHVDAMDRMMQDMMGELTCNCAGYAGPASNRTCCFAVRLSED